MVDKNLFLHDLAVVAILKNEAPYLREWLDYHLLAGVDHFYLYDNDSTDNQREVAEPYIVAGLVDYINAPGKFMQMSAYNDAVNRFKFQCRYMAFIDLDEFIYPKTNRGIVEIVDEILSPNANAAALAINWQIYGSNGHDKADTSRGILERFTRRAPIDFAPSGMGNAHVKTIANPRVIDSIDQPHSANYFDSLCAVNEHGDIVNGAFNIPATADKIAVNHYYTKSREEFIVKKNRGRADISIKYDDEWFNSYNRNEVFDDGILTYCNARTENFSLESNTQRLDRVTEALMKNLSTCTNLETTLTCRSLSVYLREHFSHDADCWQLCEESSLVAAVKILSRGINYIEARIFLREPPKLLKLPYPAVNDLRGTLPYIINQLKSVCHSQNLWTNYVKLNWLQELLTFKE